MIKSKHSICTSLEAVHTSNLLKKEGVRYVIDTRI